MSHDVIYFGTPGTWTTLPQPRGGVDTTRVRPVQDFKLGNGEGRTRKVLHGQRTFTYSWERLTADAFDAILAYDQGHMGPGPFAVLDPVQANMLLVNQAASTSLTNDATNFTIAGSGCTIASSATLATGVPRSLAWTFNFTSPASASAILTLDSPYAGWPGVPCVPVRPLCFSGLVQGGGGDAIVSFAPELLWYSSAGALVSTTTGATFTTASGSWAPFTATASAPGTAAYVLPRIHYVSGASAGSIVYFSSFQLEEGSVRNTWKPGTGILPVTVVSLSEGWPWLYSTEVRERPTLVLRQDGR